MSTILLADNRQQNTSIHPPDTKDHEILTIPDREGLRHLTLADRLSLRIGLWLLHHSLNRDRLPASGAPDLQYLQLRLLEEQQAKALLTYGLQRGMY
ncbi:hypothetical protein [Microbacterium sp. H1-D42]|uniref:hypothetical protein n=1 Tax=Microbacterium sp. H1-D42 TaxID=2925844 RepID=UPI001F532A61|nr:hypothetical protein [Microbacterium sp. H1-D42]UNK69395.1 hypothetical protein MNR00_09350 [Microbacterium sp. H1-D42]